MTQTLKAVKPKYKFSFVMPVYNVEAFLAETVESILSQTMDFKENCEIIFINDGSKDKSGDVCRQFTERFPDNITYFEQKNAGVSAARNRGIEAARGKYISFLDSDDKLSSDTLEKVYDFFEEHEREIDLVSIALRFFDAKTGNHMLNYKFDRSHVVDIEKEHESIQMSGGSIFVKNEVFQRHDYRFDGRLKYGEDVKLINEIVLDKGAYGVVAGPVYYYRKRLGGGSALNNTLHDRSWYLDIPEKVHKHLFAISKKKLGSIPRYIQFVVMYDLQWKFKQARQATLNEADTKAFRIILKELLQDIDDDIILAQRNITIEYKLFILSYKYGEDVVRKAKRRGQDYFYRDTCIYSYKESDPKFDIQFMTREADDLILEGYIRNIIFPDTSYTLETADKKIPVTLVKNNRVAYFLDQQVSIDNAFKLRVPLGDAQVIEPFLSVGENKYNLALSTHRFSYLNNQGKNAYRIMGDQIVRRGETSLHIVPYSKAKHVGHELRYMASLARRLKLGLVKATLQDVRSGQKDRRSELVTIPLRSLARNAYVIGWRLVRHIASMIIRDKIWLVSDRIKIAGDNGEALFRYIAKQDTAGRKVYFAISKDCDDYEYMKQYGEVIDRDSFKYKVYFLLSDKVISSHADDFVINAFGRFWPDLIDLYDFDFVFLQHGIIKDDISGWLNRYNKDMSIFVTSAKPEYEAVLHDNYGYGSDVVRLTGLPRYDLLESKPQGKLILAPTWRQSLAGITNEKTGIRDKSSGFQNTAYFKFYQSLISDPRLMEVFEKYNITGELYLHPALSSQIVDFKGNERFVVQDVPYDYRTAFKEGNIMVTDYSSLFFDFAYLKKPIVYTHFDSETIFNDHFYEKGYFSYEKDGFGPVAYDYESAIDQIIKTIEAGCVMSDKYEKRVEKFFYKFDTNNSKRVYEAILSLDK